MANCDWLTCWPTLNFPSVRDKFAKVNDRHTVSKQPSYKSINKCWYVIHFVRFCLRLFVWKSRAVISVLLLVPFVQCVCCHRHFFPRVFLSSHTSFGARFLFICKTNHFSRAQKKWANFCYSHVIVKLTKSHNWHKYKQTHIIALVSAHTTKTKTQWIQFHLILFTSISCIYLPWLFTSKVKAPSFPSGWKNAVISMNINTQCRTKKRTIEEKKKKIIDKTKVKHYFCVWIVCRMPFFFILLTIHQLALSTVCCLWCVYSLYICINIWLKTFNQKVTLSPMCTITIDIERNVIMYPNSN